MFGAWRVFAPLLSADVGVLATAGGQFAGPLTASFGGDGTLNALAA